MKSVTQIWERLYLGHLGDAERLSSANPNGVTTVMSLCKTAVRNKRGGINYLHLPIEDAQPLPVAQFDCIIDAIAENVRWGKVLVHCGEGISRAPILTAAWMDVVGYKNIDAALTEIARLRPTINPSDILLESVRRHLR